MNEFLELPPFKHPNPLKSFNKTKQVSQSWSLSLIHVFLRKLRENSQTKFTTREKIASNRPQFSTTLRVFGRNLLRAINFDSTFLIAKIKIDARESFVSRLISFLDLKNGQIKFQG